MTKSKTVKSLTLLCFTILIIGFVAFKAGAFDQYIGAGDAEQVLFRSQVTDVRSLPVDTPPEKAIDTLREAPAMLPSSKVMIIPDKKMRFSIKDSSQKDSAGQEK